MTIAQLEKEIKNYHNGKGRLFYMSVLTMEKTLIQGLYRELAFARFENDEN